MTEIDEIKTRLDQIIKILETSTSWQHKLKEDKQRSCEHDFGQLEYQGWNGEWSGRRDAWSRTCKKCQLYRFSMCKSTLLILPPLLKDD